ncbi:MAG: efflux RND transporter periplasmic adaptor subunit [Desulfomonile tiedjei]|nr:efflux RND transporter periplasmic adaptor subunit [Desulfomonile tiedjei]
MKIRSVEALALVFILTLVFTGCGSTGPQFPERPPAPVAVAAAVKQDVPIYLDSIGKTVAREVVSIQPQVSGRITEIHFADGADLKTGDPLFTIDPRPYEAQLASAEATLAEKKAALDLAKTQFARYAELLQTNSVSQQEYDQRKNTQDMAEAQVQQSQAAVETARLNLDYCSIRSPIDGRAGQRLVDIGNVVAANTGSLLVIQRLNPIYADFTVTESELTAVQRNMNRGALKVEVRLPEEPDKSREGELSFLDNAVQESTGTVKLRATIPNKDHYFWPGRFVKVRLVLNTLHGAVLVPAAAPQMSAKGQFVYVVKEDSTAELRPVKLGQRQDDLVVVDEGLQSGERVVVTGQLAVMPGGKVRMEEPPSVVGSSTAGQEDQS